MTITPKAVANFTKVCEETGLIKKLRQEPPQDNLAALAEFFTLISAA